MNHTPENDRDRTGFLVSVFASIQGEGPRVGESHLFVRLAGCNAGCAYCDTPEGLSIPPAAAILFGDDTFSEPNPCAAKRLGQIARGFLSEGVYSAVAITGGEPLMQPEFVAAFCRILPEGAPPILLETNGLLPAALEQILPWVDIVSADWKLASTGVPTADSKKSAEFVALAARAGKETIVKIPFGPAVRAAEIASVVSRITECAPAATIILQPISRPDGKASVPPLEILALHQECLKVNRRVRAIPQVHKVLMIR